MNRSVPALVAEVVAQLLHNRGFAAKPGTTPVSDGWRVYVGSDPGGEKAAVVYADGTGLMENRSTRDGAWEEKPGIQVRLRAADQPTGKAKGDALTVLFDSVFAAPVTVLSRQFKVINVHRTSPVMFLKQDEVGRQMIYVVNARVTLSEDL